MKALILAAGQGTRLSSICQVKPLLPVCQKPLIDWVLGALVKVGVSEVVVVTGYEGQKVQEYLKNQDHLKEIKLNFVHNEEWQKENGLSVYKARHFLTEPFFLLMSDHIFDSEILGLLKKEPLRNEGLILAVDYRIKNNLFVDLEDVTKVRVEAGFITAIGKGLADYNAFDTGIFYCTPAIFKALEESQISARDFTLSGGVRKMAARGQARVIDAGARFWIDVDDERAREKAENYLKSVGL
ncbi:MAG: NTP transferase domain-containing protein [Candidatus Saccharicenans sp.]